MVRFSTLPITDYLMYLPEGQPRLIRYADGHADHVEGNAVHFKNGIFEVDEKTPAGFEIVKAISRCKVFGTEIKHDPIKEEIMVNGRKAWLEPLSIQEIIELGPPAPTPPKPAKPKDDFDSPEPKITFEEPKVMEPPKAQVYQGATSSATMAIKSSKPTVR